MKRIIIEIDKDKVKFKTEGSPSNLEVIGALHYYRDSVMVDIIRNHRDDPKPTLQDPAEHHSKP
jgi:hypothetical protein